MELLDLLRQIPRLPMRQDSTNSQLVDLYNVANKLGMYDAADVIHDLLKARGVVRD